MPRERVAMRKIREILRLVWSCNQSRRDTSRTCGVGKTTVDDTINRATAAGFTWPLPADLDDEALELRLYAQWKKARVHIDYHVDVDGHFYSVPHRLVKEQVDVRYTETVVECFYKRNRVASHHKSSIQGKHTTTPEHMPKAHREFAEWTPERIISWAAVTGTATAQVVEDILSRRAYPEHGFRSCMGVISLAKRYTKERLEAACERAVTIKGVTYKSIKSILENNLDQKALSAAV